MRLYFNVDFSEKFKISSKDLLVGSDFNLKMTGVNPFNFFVFDISVINSQKESVGSLSPFNDRESRILVRT